MRRRLPFLLFVALGGALALLARPAAQEPTSWRILVVNDDGIDNPRLAALVAAMAELGEVVVTAPDSNRSGASQSSQVFSTPMVVTPREIPGATAAWALSGTPADCAAYGVIALGGERGFDLVVSGINSGSNVGEVAHYSGTVGAATEGAMRGIPAIAVSEESRIADPSFSAAFAVRFARRLLEEGAAPGVVYSINVPTAEPQGVAVTPMGGMLYQLRGFAQVESEDGGTSQRALVARGREFPAGSDTAGFIEGMVTVTPLQIDWTHRGELERLTGWELAAAAD
ncbi:MAG: 5'/3'-nucleotidase SurE [Planctomycetota bacterium]